MKDFLSKDLEVGDDIVFVQVGYKNLLKGVVIKLTPKMVLIKHRKLNNGITETRQFPDQVIKIV